LLGLAPANISEHWTSFDVGGGHLALHLTDEADLGPGQVELSLVADEPLEAVADRVGGEVNIVDQPFGRSFVVTDPDGTKIQINEH
jgi:hypothetical protein